MDEPGDFGLLKRLPELSRMFFVEFLEFMQVFSCIRIILFNVAYTSGKKPAAMFGRKVENIINHKKEIGSFSFSLDRMIF